VIPIKKLIYVTDEFGNQYAPTYPKRAAGLVKHGRAHYVSDDTICLVCPPSSYETEELNMTENQTTYTIPATDTASPAVNPPESAVKLPATPTISLQTAIRILRTIEQNRHEPVAFWASKTAYSGVYRAAVQNGWITDGVFVTDIPEGVDGGFLGADMIRISLMASLLIDVLSDQLPPEAEADTDALSDTVDRLIEERVRIMLDEAALEASIAEAFDNALEEIEAAKDDALSAIADATDDC